MYPKLCLLICNGFETEFETVIDQYLANQGEAYTLPVFFGAERWGE